MATRKAGPMKKAKRKGLVQQSNPTKRLKVDATTTHKAVKKHRDRSAVELVPSHEIDLSDCDVDNLDEYKDFDRFLHNLDPQALAKKSQRQKSGLKPEPRHDLARRESEDNSVIDNDNSIMETETPSEVDFKAERQSTPAMVTHEPETIRSFQGHRKSTDYEDVVRSFRDVGDTSSRLPIIMTDGTLQHVIIKETLEAPQISEASRFHSSAESKKDGRSESPVESAVAHTQEQLAKLAMEIIEDPEEHIDKIGKIKDIQHHSKPLECRYAIMTLSVVFRDIIPGYRIRPLSVLEKAEHTTKDVRRLRHFEQTLYTQYQEYVASLVELAKTPRNKGPCPTPFKDTAVTAACALLDSAPHFNFRTDLLGIIVNQVCRRTVDPLFIKCRTALENLLQEDTEGEASLDALRVLCKRLKDREYQVDESTIAIFLHVNLLNAMESRGSTTKIDHVKHKKKERQFRTKKLKKLIKDQKEVDRDMREAEAAVNSETRERLQGDMLKLVFTTYFRMLQAQNRLTMGPSLEGLARFAHLINVDFFGDLLEVLKELLSSVTEQGDLLTTREALLCIVTAFSILSGQGSTKETISLDLSAFTNKLYSILLSMALNANIESSTKGSRFVQPESGKSTATAKINVTTEAEMLLRALDAVFFQQRAQGHAKLAAFIKRLSTSTLHFPEKSCRTSLELIRRLVTRYTKLTSLYSTEESAGDGRYDGETDNLELCNHAATSIFEMALYRKHFSPKIAESIETLTQSLLEANSAVR